MTFKDTPNFRCSSPPSSNSHRRTHSGHCSSGALSDSAADGPTHSSASCATAESHVVILSPSEDATDDDDDGDYDEEEGLLLKGERAGLGGSVGRGIDALEDEEDEKRDRLMGRVR